MTANDWHFSKSLIIISLITGYQHIFRASSGLLNGWVCVSFFKRKGFCEQKRFYCGNGSWDGINLSMFFMFLQRVFSWKIFIVYFKWSFLYLPSLLTLFYVDSSDASCHCRSWWENVTLYTSSKQLAHPSVLFTKQALDIVHNYL